MGRGRSGDPGRSTTRRHLRITAVGSLNRWPDRVLPLGARGRHAARRGSTRTSGRARHRRSATAHALARVTAPVADACPRSPHVAHSRPDCHAHRLVAPATARARSVLSFVSPADAGDRRRRLPAASRLLQHVRFLVARPPCWPSHGSPIRPVSHPIAMPTPVQGTAAKCARTASPPPAASTSHFTKERE